MARSFQSAGRFFFVFHLKTLWRRLGDESAYCDLPLRSDGGLHFAWGWRSTVGKDSVGSNDSKSR